MSDAQRSEAQPEDQPEQQTVIVVGPGSMGVAGGDEDRNPADMVEHPAKVMRIGSMIKQLLEEVRDAPLDEAGRARLAAVHERSMAELEQGLSPELVDELRRISLPFDESATPSDAELRIAQAQLVGWLEGLFHGIQTALVAQQMAAQRADRADASCAARRPRRPRRTSRFAPRAARPARPARPARRARRTRRARPGRDPRHRPVPLSLSPS